jgi:hypothetical protein
MAKESFVIIDKKSKDGEFICEKIIKSSQFQEGKDWNNTLGINTYKILSLELKKRILSRDNPSNDKVYIDASNLEMEVWIDRGSEVDNEFLRKFFVENPFYKDMLSEEDKKRLNEDREDEEISISHPIKPVIWWTVGMVSFMLFTSFLVYLFRKRKKVKK